MKTVKHSENIFLFVEDIEGYPTNSVLILMAEKNILIDTLASPQQISPVFVFLKEQNKASQPLWVINTHHHWDHIWGNMFFTGCPIISHASCRQKIIASGEKILKTFQEKSSFYESVEIYPPNITFDQKLIFYEQDYTLEIEHFPSHTRDCISLYIPELKLLIAGDILEYPFPMLEWVGGTLNYIKGLQGLLKKEIETVIPGHGPATGIELIRDNLTYIENLYKSALSASHNNVPLKNLYKIDPGSFLTDRAMAFLRPLDKETHHRNLERVYLDVINAKSY